MPVRRPSTSFQRRISSALTASLLAEPDLDLFVGAIADAPVALREGAVVRPHRQDGAKPGCKRGFAVGIAVRGMVAAVDVVASPQQRDRGGDAGLQALEQREPGFGAPEVHRRVARVDLRAGMVPCGAVARPERAHQPVPGVRVAVDETGQRRHAAPVEGFGGTRMIRGDFGVRPHCNDAPALDRDGGVVEHPAPGVERYRGDVSNQDVGHGHLAMGFTVQPLPSRQAGRRAGAGTHRRRRSARRPRSGWRHPR